MNTDDEFAANAAILARDHPPFVLRNRTLVAQFDYDWSNPLDRWIDDHYAAAAANGAVEILAHRELHGS